jgi:apolipoprotein N-acyltransferase
VLTATFEGREGLTPFAWWAARFSLWPLALLAALLAVLAAVLVPLWAARAARRPRAQAPAGG